MVCDDYRIFLIWSVYLSIWGFLVRVYCVLLLLLLLPVYCHGVIYTWNFSFICSRHHCWQRLGFLCEMRFFLCSTNCHIIKGSSCWRSGQCVTGWRRYYCTWRSSQTAPQNCWFSIVLCLHFNVSIDTCFKLLFLTRCRPASKLKDVQFSFSLFQ